VTRLRRAGAKREREAEGEGARDAGHRERAYARGEALEREAGRGRERALSEL